MRPKRNRSAAPLLNSTDRLGRVIDPSILSAAEQIARTALSYGEKLLGDSALAASLLEEAAANVSETLRRKARIGTPPIKDLGGYLFRAYARRMRVERETQLTLDFGTEQDWENHANRPDDADPERQLLVKQVLGSCDPVTREIVYRRLEGLSWKEIEVSSGVPANAAKLKFSKSLRRLREKFKKHA
jgi:DNA-directed RNA polymerase specialized sigma24 family protein